MKYKLNSSHGYMHSSGIMFEPRATYDDSVYGEIIKSVPEMFVKVEEKEPGVRMEEGIVLPKGMKRRVIKPKAEDGAVPLYMKDDFDAKNQ